MNQDIGIGAAVGGISAGLSKYAGGFLPQKNFGAQLAGRTVIGGVIGGSVAVTLGGDFGQGFQNGAITSALGFLTNETAHEAGLVDSVGNAVKSFFNAGLSCCRGRNEGSPDSLGKDTRPSKSSCGSYIDAFCSCNCIRCGPYVMTAAGGPLAQTILYEAPAFIDAPIPDPSNAPPNQVSPGAALGWLLSLGR